MIYGNTLIVSAFVLCEMCQNNKIITSSAVSQSPSSSTEIQYFQLKAAAYPSLNNIGDFKIRIIRMMLL